MGVVTKPIILEDVLRTVFSYLPDMPYNVGDASYPVVFGSGDEIALNQFLANREETTVYPIIWMLYPGTEDHQRNRLVAENITFILAMENMNISMENEDRINTTFKKVLLPLQYNMRLAILRSNVLSFTDKEESLKTTKYPNYSKTDARTESGTIAIWDALKVVVGLNVTGECIKSITI